MTAKITHNQMFCHGHGMNCDKLYPTVNVEHDQLQLLQYRPPIDFQSGILEILIQVAHLYNLQWNI